MAAYSGFGAPRDGPSSRPRSRTEDFPMSDRGQNTTNTHQSLAQPEGESSTWGETIKSHIPQGIKNLWNNKGGQEEDGTGVDQQGSHNGQMAMVPRSRCAVTSQPEGNARDGPDDWENVDLPMEEVLRHALEELEVLRRKQTSNLIKISDLEQRAVVAETSAQSKEGAIAKLVKQIQELELPEHKGMTPSDDSEQDRILVIKIDTLQASEEQLRKECKEKEQQRFEATQQTLTLREELRVLGSKSDQNEARYNEAIEENKNLKEKVADFSKLQREKYEIEDERDILKIEMDAESDNVKSLKKQLAESQVAVASLESSLKASPIPKHVGVDEKDQEIQLLKTGRQLFQVEVEESKRNLKRSQKALADTERASPIPKPVGVVDKDQEIQLMKTEYQLFQVETEENKRTLKRSQKALADTRLSLERKLKNVSDERDELSQSVTQLQASNRLARQRLNDVGKQLQVTMDHAEQLSKTVEEKTNRVNALEDKVKKLEELEATKLQAQLYEEDFKQERRDREQAAGTKVSEYGKFHVSMQKLSDELNSANDEVRRAQQIANEARAEKRAVIKKLELSVSEVQQMHRQSEQAERDFQAALQTKDEEDFKQKLGHGTRKPQYEQDGKINQSSKFVQKARVNRIVLKSCVAEHEKLQQDLQSKTTELMRKVSEIQSVSREMDNFQTKLKQSHSHFDKEEEDFDIYQEQAQEQREKRLKESQKTIDRQRETILELEQKVKELELGHESMGVAIDERQAHIDKLTRDRIGMVEHSKKQCRIIIDLKTEIEDLKQTNQQMEATLTQHKQQRSSLDAAFRKQSAEKAKLEAEVKKLLEYTEQHKQLQSELDRIRGERNELKERVGHLEEAEKKSEFYQQKTIWQQAMLENLQKDLGDSRRKTTQLTSGLERQQTEIHQVAKHRDELLGELEAHKLTLKDTVEEMLKVKLNQAERVKRHLDQKLKQAQAKITPSQPLLSQRYHQTALDRFRVRPRRKLTFDHKIGEGCYGSVYAINLDGTPCIAKRLQDILMGRGQEERVNESTKESFHEKFIRECVLMSQTNHPNIVKFIGVHFGKDKYDLTLIMERLSTDLQQYITTNPDMPFPTKVSILQNVSSGLLYLHQECSIIHRDLSAGNILLTDDNKAKITDLGVSRIFDRSLSQLSKLPGTLAFMPPEALKDNPQYDKSLDIFSFGVVALYVAIQEFPDFSWERVPEAIMAKGEGEIHKRHKWIAKMDAQQPELISLVLWCLCDDPVSRPSTVCLNILLNEMSKDYN